jgi:hypothetical protein
MIEFDGSHHFGPSFYGGMEASHHDNTRRDRCKDVQALLEGTAVLRIACTLPDIPKLIDQFIRKVRGDFCKAVWSHGFGPDQQLLASLRKPRLCHPVGPPRKCGPYLYAITP